MPTERLIHQFISRDWAVVRLVEVRYPGLALDPGVRYDLRRGTLRGGEVTLATLRTDDLGRLRNDIDAALARVRR